MKLLYGTSNKSKIQSMKEYVAPLGIEILSLSDVSAQELEINESGTHPLENARIKALAYYKALKIPVFSCDSGMYIHGLEDARQPGVHVRRINGRRLHDDEMIAHYAALAKEFGGSVTARYINAICLVLDEGVTHEYAGDDIASQQFMIVDKPHPMRSEGFPIDSLSVDISSGMYYYDDINNTKDRQQFFGVADGFAAFFRRVLHI
ncbi:MAG: hypothetical protein FWC92_10465 [Defluviitaleaceae bacterium]|nr:hypothetical protein [Defluviitaleaceae bacterium]